MHTHIKRPDLEVSLALVELLARMGTVASIAVLATLFQAEALQPSLFMKKEALALLFFPVGVVAGLVISWWREGSGVLLTLGSLLAAFLVDDFPLRYHVSDWGYVFFAAPSFLFLIHWILNHGAKQVMKA